jgi:hypothetical protein
MKIKTEQVIKIIEKYIGGLVKDYGYCNCKRKHKDMHMDICNDLEKIKKLIIKDIKKIKESLK